VRSVLGLALLIASPALAQPTAAGFAPASFRVTESGAAEYRIPIRVPPGIAGVEPKLALVYNSQAGNGLLGVGWSLEGLSAITRCPRTLAQDGVRGGVNHDWNDRYCLDGQRLIAISGSYGADGTEYRTERESFTRVVSYGGADNGPASFKAWTKSGEILEYGHTIASRIEAQGKPTVVRVWALSRASDSKGNQFSVSYAEDSTNGQFRPDRIDYAGNLSVRFVYEARPDINPLYEAGSLVKTTVRLANARTYVAEARALDYRVTYELSPTTSRSRPTSVTQCDGAGSACLAPTVLGWQSGSNQFSLAGQGYPIPGADYGPGHSGWLMSAGDFNGDGRIDFVRIHPVAGVHTYFSNGDGTFSLATYGYSIPGADYGPDQSGWLMTAGDFDGDARTDFLRIHPTVGTHAYLSNGNGSYRLVAQSYSIPGADYGPGHSGWLMSAGDFDGDGRIDFVRIHPVAGVHTYFSNGDGTFSLATYGYSIPGADYGPDQSGWLMTVGDLDGDARTDFLRIHPMGGTHAYLSNGNGSYRLVAQGYSIPGADYGPGHSGWLMSAGDFNGDGRIDFVRIHPVAGVHTYLSNGDGTFSLAVYGYSIPGADYGPDQSGWLMTVGDFDGDARTDFLRIHPMGGTHAYLSNGNGSYRLVAQGYSIPGADYGPGHSGWLMGAGDFNGDGRSDFIRIHPTGGTHAYLMSGAFADLLSSAATGLAATAITYKPLSDSAVYTKDTGGDAAAYPNADLQLPLHVVYAAASSNGIGSSEGITQKYGGLKSNHAGRGSLGFRWTESTRQSTGLKVRTENHQSWPYVGLPSLVRKTQASGALLSQTLNTYDSISSGSGVYFPFVSQSVESGHDLNGAPLPVVATTTSYDNFGNPVVITVNSAEGQLKVTTNTYLNDLASWRLGRLTRSTVERTSP
jgi:hypothetical protein